MEQCPFCREPKRFLSLLEELQQGVLTAKRQCEILRSEINGMVKVETHMHYLTRELADFKTDRRHLMETIRALTRYVKKTGIVP